MGDFVSMAYLGRMPCGCAMSVIVDDAKHRKTTSKTLACWVRRGMSVERLPTPEALGRIRAAIAETGYHRRDTELAELEATVNGR